MIPFHPVFIVLPLLPLSLALFPLPSPPLPHLYCLLLPPSFSPSLIPPLLPLSHRIGRSNNPGDDVSEFRILSRVLVPPDGGDDGGGVDEAAEITQMTSNDPGWIWRDCAGDQGTRRSSGICWKALRAGTLGWLALDESTGTAG